MDNDTKKTNDTIPTPPPCIDPELLEAYAADVGNLAGIAAGIATELRSLSSSMTKQVAEARKIATT